MTDTETDMKCKVLILFILVFFNEIYVMVRREII